MRHAQHAAVRALGKPQGEPQAFDEADESASRASMPRHGGRHVAVAHAEARHAQHGLLPAGYTVDGVREAFASKAGTARSGASHSGVVGTVSVVDVRTMLLRELNTPPTTRRAIREKKQREARKQNIMLAGVVTVLLGTTGSLCMASATGVFPQLPQSVAATQSVTRTDGRTDGLTDGSVSADSDELSSRSDDRTSSVDTSTASNWDGETTLGQLKVNTLSSHTVTLPAGTQIADGIWKNSEVYLADAQDVDVPDSIDHQTGDTGDSYPYGQCTWWAYERRHQLGLPVGSNFGDARNWAAAAQALGYSVDNAPRVGDIVVFQPGQAGADRTYGHVAIVEAVVDGKIVISEANAGGALGQTTSRTLANAQNFTYIHY
ncbi:MAG: CHAP domain-containing protein [Bifidobacteriaceae bacterium]|nr:CHAP domain-containing protein [Bifidobacteriaceae bacterium]